MGQPGNQRRDTPNHQRHKDDEADEEKGVSFLAPMRWAAAMMMWPMFAHISVW
jgi:hypothetical protein